jgi:hypothetical protein
MHHSSKLLHSVLCAFYLSLLVSTARSSMLFNCRGEGAEEFEGFEFPAPVYTHSYPNFAPFNATMAIFDDTTTCQLEYYQMLAQSFVPEFPGQQLTVWVSDNGGCSHGLKLDYAQQAGIAATIVSSLGDGTFVGQTGREVNQPFEHKVVGTTPLFELYVGDLAIIAKGIAEHNCSISFYPDVNPWLVYYASGALQAYQGIFLSFFGILIIAGIFYIVVNAIYIRKLTDVSSTSRHTSTGRASIQSVSSKNTTTHKSTDDESGAESNQGEELQNKKTATKNSKSNKKERRLRKKQQASLIFNAAITVFIIETVSNIFNFIYNLDPYSYLGLFTRSELLAIYYCSYNIPVVSTLLLAIEWLHISHQKSRINNKTSSWLIANKLWFILGTSALVGMTVIEAFIIGTYNVSGIYGIIARAISYATGVGTTIFFLVAISSCIRQIQERLKTINEHNSKRRRAAQQLVQRMIAAAVIISVAIIGNIMVDIIALTTQFQNFTATSVVYFIIRSTLIVAQSAVKIFGHNMKKKMKIVFCGRPALDSGSTTVLPNSAIATEKNV